MATTPSGPRTAGRSCSTAETPAFGRYIACASAPGVRSSSRGDWRAASFRCSSRTCSPAESRPPPDHLVRRRVLATVAIEVAAPAVHLTLPVELESHHKELDRVFLARCGEAEQL